MQCKQLAGERCSRLIIVLFVLACLADKPWLKVLLAGVGEKYCSLTEKVRLISQTSSNEQGDGSHFDIDHMERSAGNNGVCLASYGDYLPCLLGC